MNSPSALYSRYALLEFAYSDLIIMIISFCIPNLYNSDHNPSWYTRSNAFLKSMQLWNRFFWMFICFSITFLQLNTCSIALLPFRNLVCSSDNISSTWGFSRLRIMDSSILLEWQIKLRFNFINSITSDSSIGNSYSIYVLRFALLFKTLISGLIW